MSGAFKNFNLINIPNKCNGTLEVYLIPACLLFSFVSYTDAKNDQKGILELGADMPLHKRPTIILRDGKLLPNLIEVHKKIIKNRKPAIVKP